MTTSANTITRNEKLIFTNSLKESLAMLSEGKLSKQVAGDIASSISDQIDLNNEALMHRGTQSLAKEILSKIKFS